MRILIRGAGDLASGIALRLHRAHMKIIMTDLPIPTSIRRTVCFSEAIRLGRAVLEGVEGVFAHNPTEAPELTKNGKIAVLADPDGSSIPPLKPDVVVDAILAKRNLNTALTDAPIVIGVGPGFTVGKDCHAAVETMRGHTLGRVLYEGSPLPNTNIPGLIGGFAGERVLRAPASGVFCPVLQIGDTVQAGDIAATVDGVPMRCTIGGVLRGLLCEGVEVHEGMKSGDVDPRGKKEYCTCASDKALAIGGGVLEAILSLSGILEDNNGK